MTIFPGCASKKYQKELTMRKAICLFAVILTSFSSSSLAIPTSITYQGTIKEKSVSKSGPRNMLNRIINSGDTQVYWSSGNLSGQVGYASLTQSIINGSPSF